MACLTPTASDRSAWLARAGLSGLGLLSALLLVWGSAGGSNPAQQLAAVLLTAGLGSVALCWVALDRRFEHTPLAWVLGQALLLRLVAVQASPLLEDDHYRYLWDGLRTATHFDPYSLPPSAFFADQHLPAAWQDILSGINNPDIPTIYGPVLQGLFALAYWMAPGQLGPIQTLLLLADMAVLLLLAAETRRRGASTRWLLAYALHPLLLKEAMASAHPDGLVALFLLLALLAWQGRRPVWLGVALGLATGSKVSALVVLPLLLLAPRPQVAPAAPQATPAPGQVRWALCSALAFITTLALLYLPFLAAGGSDAQALATFGQQWRFNPLLYRVVEALVPAAAARAASAALVVASIGLLAWQWRRRSQSAGPGSLPPLDLALIWLLLLSPVVNPWYWLWALALCAYLGRGWMLVGSAVAFASYLNSSVLFEALGLQGPGAFTPYLVAWPLGLTQLGVLLAALFMGRDRRTAL